MSWFFYWLGAYAVALFGAIVYHSEFTTLVAAATYMAAFPSTAVCFYREWRKSGKGRECPEPLKQKERPESVGSEVLDPLVYWPQNLCLIADMYFRKKDGDEVRRCPFCPPHKEVKVYGRNYVSHLRGRHKGGKSPLAGMDHKTAESVLREVWTRDIIQKEKS